MRPIALVSRQRLRKQPEFKLLRMPPWNLRGVGLAAAAEDMANAAEKYTDLFIEEGLVPDFAAKLREATDRLNRSIDARGQGRGQRAGATAGLTAETKRARIRIQLLDSLVRPLLGTNDELLREWEVAKHIQRARRHQSATSDGEASPATDTLSLTPAAAPPATAA